MRVVEELGEEKGRELAREKKTPYTGAKVFLGHNSHKRATFFSK